MPATPDLYRVYCPGSAEWSEPITLEQSAMLLGYLARTFCDHEHLIAAVAVSDMADKKRLDERQQRYPTIDPRGDLWERAHRV